jgi:predicted transposase/invertase (TIGR01784 family)
MQTDDFVIKPTSDLFIAALWSPPENEPILRSLINGVMTDSGLPPIRKATVLNPFNIQDYAGDKRIVLDVRVEDESGTFYNVEVQRESDASFLNRMLFGWADTYGSQLQWGEKYGELCPVRSIIITEFPIFPMLKQLHAVFELRAREDAEVLFSDHCQIHVLRLGDLMRNNLAGLDQFGLDLQRWMQFWVFGSEWEESKMNTMLEDSPAVLQAYEEYKRFSADPVMREKVRALERFQVDQRLKLGTARREGEKKGREEGREEGLAVGLERTARQMKKKGYSVTEITELTGLSETEIEQLH